MDRPRRVLAISQGRIPSVELAAIYPFTWLEEDGHCEFRYRDAADTRADDLLWCNVLYIVRGGSERIHMIANEARNLKRVVIGYWDDNPYNVPESSSSHASFAAMLPRITRIMQCADLAVCSTEYCAEAFRKVSGGEVHVISSCPVVSPLGKWDQRSRDKSGRRFGYAGSTDHWPIVESVIFPALEEMLRRNEVFTCEIMGPSVKVPPHLKDFVVLRPPVLCYKEWIEVRNNLPWNFALAPLNPSEFNRCKTPNKFLEYSAAGIPCIFSRVEPYTHAVVHGETGLLVENTAAAWADAISGLLHDLPRSETLARNALNHVTANYGRETIVKGYEHLLDQVNIDDQSQLQQNRGMYKIGFSIRLFWHLLSWRTFRLKVMNLCSRIRRSV